MALALTAWASTGALAQPQAPLPPSAPPGLVSPGLVVHVVAHEDLEPDALRALARPGVTLWLETRSNTLRESTLEHLGRFDEAWVRLRLPLGDVPARQLRRHPRLGAWLSVAAATGGSTGQLPGVRRVAVDVAGPLDEALAERLRAGRVSLTRWTPGAAIDVLSWSLFRALPGRRVLAPDPGGLLAVQCPVRTATEPSLELDVATLLALSSDVFPCSAGTRVVVRPDVDAWLVQSMVVRDPSLELVLRVGADGDEATRVAHFLDGLGLPRR